MFCYHFLSRSYAYVVTEVLPAGAANCQAMRTEGTVPTQPVAAVAPVLVSVVLLQTQAGFTHAVACTGQSSPAGSRASSVERQRDSIDRLSQPRHVGMQSPSSRRPWGSPARPDSRGAARDANTRIQRGSSCEAHENSGNTKPCLQACMNLSL